MTEHSYPAPDSETYDDVVTETFDLSVRGGTTPTFLARPSAPGPHPGVVIGAEGTGPNSFIRKVAATLAHLGYVAIVADYYRGTGPADPEDYSDIDDMVAHIDAVCKATGKAVIVYNRDNGIINEDSLARLCDRNPNLVGFKDGVGDIELMMRVYARMATG